MVTAGLSKATDGWNARRRALIHFHGSGLTPKRLVLEVSPRGAARSSVELVLRVGSEVVERAPISAPRQTVFFDLPATGDDVELALAATGAGARPARPYRIHRIRLERSWLPWGVLRLLGVLGAGLLGLVLTRGRPWPGRLALAAWAMASATGLIIVATDPAAACQLAPGTRTALQLAGLALLWWLALMGTGGVLRAHLTLLATVLWVHLPTIHYGFVNEDLYFTHAYSFGDLVRVAVGAWNLHEGVPGFYRPLFVWNVALEHGLWGADPRGYHATSLVLLAVSGMVGLALLCRLGLSVRHALAGSILWLAHPLSASAAAWVAQRTDSLTLPFFLGAVTLALPPGTQRGSGPSPGCPCRPSRVARAGRLALAGGLAGAALLSKEWAVALPAVVVLALLARDGFRQWREAVGWGIGFLTMVGVYLAWWTSFLPGRVARRPWMETLLQVPRFAIGVLGPVFAPTTFRHWIEASSTERLPRDAIALVLLLALGWLAFRRGSQQLRLVVLAAAWPVVLAAPLLLRPFRDFYRLGLPLALGLAMAWAVLSLVAEGRWRRVMQVSTIVAGLWLAWLAIDAAACWSPGYSARSSPQWRPSRYSGLTPEMARYLEVQRWRRTHARRWVAAGEAAALDSPPPAPPLE